MISLEWSESILYNSAENTEDYRTYYNEYLFNVYLNKKNEFLGKKEELEKFLILHKINPDFSEVQSRIQNYMENYAK
jgi:hypothetical protein